VPKIRRRGRVSSAEAARRSFEWRCRREAGTILRRAFSLETMVENASIVVLTRGQMNGLRSIIKRMGLASAESVSPSSG
jgi:hypothetical protein